MLTSALLAHGEAIRAPQLAGKMGIGGNEARKLLRLMVAAGLMDREQTGPGPSSVCWHPRPGLTLEAVLAAVAEVRQRSVSDYPPDEIDAAREDEDHWINTRHAAVGPPDRAVRLPPDAVASVFHLGLQALNRPASSWPNRGQ